MATLRGKIRKGYKENSRFDSVIPMQHTHTHTQTIAIVTWRMRTMVHIDTTHDCDLCVDMLYSFQTASAFVFIMTKPKNNQLSRPETELRNCAAAAPHRSTSPIPSPGKIKCRRHVASFNLSPFWMLNSKVKIRIKEFWFLSKGYLFFLNRLGRTKKGVVIFQVTFRVEWTIEL